MCIIRSLTGSLRVTIPASVTKQRPTSSLSVCSVNASRPTDTGWMLQAARGETRNNCVRGPKCLYTRRTCHTCLGLSVPKAKIVPKNSHVDGGVRGEVRGIYSVHRWGFITERFVVIPHKVLCKDVSVAKNGQFDNAQIASARCHSARQCRIRGPFDPSTRRTEARQIVCGLQRSILANQLGSVRLTRSAESL